MSETGTKVKGYVIAAAIAVVAVGLLAMFVRQYRNVLTSGTISGEPKE